MRVDSESVKTCLLGYLARTFAHHTGLLLRMLIRLSTKELLGGGDGGRRTRDIVKLRYKYLITHLSWTHRR